MDADGFKLAFQQQIKQCEEILVVKAGEYAEDTDRLYNFKVAARLQGTSLRKALAGMMAKHTVSVYDLCQADTLAPAAVWDEKLTDHINYLILLRAVVQEEMGESRKDTNA